MIDSINDNWSIFAPPPDRIPFKYNWNNLPLGETRTHVEAKAPAIIKIDQFVDAATILCYVYKKVHLHGTINTHMNIYTCAY